MSTVKNASLRVTLPSWAAATVSSVRTVVEATLHESDLAPAALCARRMREGAAAHRLRQGEGARTERAYRAGRTKWCKPISCALYPIREKHFANGLTGLNYHRWDVCRPAVELGRRLGLPVYKFLREPLIRRFGEDWYRELEEVAAQMEAAE